MQVHGVDMTREAYRISVPMDGTEVKGFLPEGLVMETLGLSRRPGHHEVYHWLDTHAKAVISALDDWYLYGLVLTDVDFVKTFFTHVQNRMGDSVKKGNLEKGEVRSALRNYFQLKESWQFSAGDKRLGKYYFSEAEYRIARIEYEKHLQMKPSRFDTIFVSLASGFRTEEEVLEAESIIEEKIEQFIAVCR